MEEEDENDEVTISVRWLWCGDKGINQTTVMKTNRENTF